MRQSLSQHLAITPKPPTLGKNIVIPHVILGIHTQFIILKLHKRHLLDDSIQGYTNVLPMMLVARGGT